ncbi:Abi family protein [Lactococcus petauri]|uniref:Abi family protein n=1 Tax=Lactococcus petauri TaxID=1940789 RepID=UPI0018AB37E1|nr:Abi family protein [Lactococcus petauri]MDC0825742.1 Abi family protein [Lactococcus petauri]
MKLAKSYDDQLDILESRGLYIDDREKAFEILSNVNYYNLTGYLFPFKDSQGNYEHGVNFDQGVALYNFDRELHAFLSSIITEIEQSLKTKVAHAIAMSFPEEPCCYEEENFFTDKNEHEKFMYEFSKSVNQNNRVDFVKHHIHRYDGHFPIWVAVQLFTLGNLKVLYANSPAKARKEVSKVYDVSPIIMDSWINCVRLIRNLTAHNMRLYGSTFYKMPKKAVGKVEYTGSNHLWGYFLLLRYLYHDKEKWIDKAVQLREIFSRYLPYINLNKIGFPDDWFVQLTTPVKTNLKFKGRIISQ